MDPNLLDQMLTAHQEFLEKLDEQTESIRKSRTPSADALKAKQDLLASERKRLKDLKEGKSQAITRFETEIQRQTARVGSLEKEIEEDKKSLESEKKEQPGSGDQKVPIAKPLASKKATAKQASRAKKKSG